jgi:hypothetical protein
MIVARTMQCLAVLLAAVWLPATAHCTLERAGVIEVDECCATPTGGEPTGTHSCEMACTNLESTNYKLPRIQQPIPAPAVLFLPVADLEAPSPPQPAPIALIDSPPEPSVPWQFVSRAALPPRAP